MQITERQIKMIESDWAEYSGEKLNIEIVGSCVYGYGSELACLRIFHSYLKASAKTAEESKMRVEYSKNLKSWFFSLEVNI